MVRHPVSTRTHRTPGWEASPTKSITSGLFEAPGFGGLELPDPLNAAFNWWVVPDVSWALAQ